ncbi:MAG: DUF1232 domain-containing protein [Acidobacteriota bacterium]|nr:DUF1232 domain-containing protein [Acidobacteriota bacterium]MDH3525336.1 DUF1232 domain-containing protein [Acidobacteriota bacterium]
MLPADLRGRPASPRLLGFYDRLRERIADAAEARGGRYGPRAAAALLLVPDVFMLLARLGLDRDVPEDTRRTLLGALAYFVLPLDLLPEIVVGPWGFLDDVALASIVIARALGPDLEELAARHWSGSGEAREVLTQVARSAESLLGESLFGRLRRLLARRGIEI